MLCPYCISKTRIYNSRSSSKQSQTWRRHRCNVCRRTFTTREKIDWDGVVEVQYLDKTYSAPYSRERLLLSLIRASANLTLPVGAITNLCDSIENQLQHSHFFDTSPQESTLITNTATAVLQRFEPNAALQYINLVFRNNPPLELVRKLLKA